MKIPEEVPKSKSKEKKEFKERLPTSPKRQRGEERTLPTVEFDSYHLPEDESSKSEEEGEETLVKQFLSTQVETCPGCSCCSSSNNNNSITLMHVF